MSSMNNKKGTTERSHIVPKRKLKDPYIKKEPIKMKRGTLKLGKNQYPTLTITVYDYHNGKDLEVHVSTLECEQALQKVYFAPDGAYPKEQKERYVNIYNQYLVFLKEESFDRSHTPVELKDIVEKNLPSNK